MQHIRKHPLADLQQSLATFALTHGKHVVHEALVRKNSLKDLPLRVDHQKAQKMITFSKTFITVVSFQT